MDPFNISGVNGGKEGKQGKGGLYVTIVITYQKPHFGKRKTGDSLPRSWRRGGIQHHIFMAIPEYN